MEALVPTELCARSNQPIIRGPQWAAEQSNDSIPKTQFRSIVIAQTVRNPVGDWIVIEAVHRLARRHVVSLAGMLLVVACGRPGGGTPQTSATLLPSQSPAETVAPSPTPTVVQSATAAPTTKTTPPPPPCPAPGTANLAAPPPRIGAALAYDGVSGKLLLFSGVRGDVTPQSCPGWIFNDSWSWDGHGWTELHPPTSPPGRSFGNMTFDESRRKTILFGGGAANSDAGKQDTWSWDGISWTLLHPSSSPGHLEQASIAYDAARQSVVLFGPGAAPVTAQTWVWNGTAWLNPQPAVMPPFRVQAAMAYDVSNRLVILFGGFPGESGGLNDTWTWDGSHWQQLHPKTSPPGGPGVAAYDPLHRQVVLFVNGETWSWDGGDWNRLRPSLSPQPRFFASMAYDPAIGKLVLFGGKSIQSNVGGESVNNELWSWDGTSWKQET